MIADHIPRSVKIQCYACNALGGYARSTTGASWEALGAEAQAQAQAAGFATVRGLGTGAGALKVMNFCPDCQAKIKAALNS